MYILLFTLSGTYGVWDALKSTNSTYGLDYGSSAPTSSSLGGLLATIFCWSLVSLWWLSACFGGAACGFICWIVRLVLGFPNIVLCFVGFCRLCAPCLYVCFMYFVSFIIVVGSMSVCVVFGVNSII